MSLPIQHRTPKKFRKSQSEASSCRLCGSVGDRSHSKNLFKKSNRELLVLAEAIMGESIPHHENLPQLLCRACERRIGHFKEFRTKIRESQKTFGRFSKRCVEMSPSLVRVAKAPRHSQTGSVSQIVTCPVVRFWLL